MSHEQYLHEDERLLLSRRSSPATLILSLLRGCVEAIVTIFVLGIAIGAVAFLGFGTTLGYWVYGVLFGLILLLILLQRFRNWNEGRFRVTTERILVADPRGFFHLPLTTIKWSQYQESEVGHRQAIDVLFLARPLHIRHGTADARREVSFPSLRWAEDIKHFLDKVDAALRRNEGSTLTPFIAKKRGKRDV